MDGDNETGERLRRIRTRRGLSLRAAAGLAGFSASHLSMIENGRRAIDKRSTLEAFALALQVHPTDITGSAAHAPEDRETGAAVAGLRRALAESDMGEPADADPLPWPDVAARLAAMNAGRPRADYAARGEQLPALIPDLHAHLAGPHRRAALVGLVDCYSAAQAASRNLGVPDLAMTASRHVRDACAALGGPEWAGLAAWSRAIAIGSAARQRAHRVAVRGADALTGELDRPVVGDVFGMLHLTAALAATTLGRPDTAADHVREARDAARRPGAGTGFGHLSFGQGNVDVWRVMLAVEAGETGRAVEVARAADPTTLPASPSRRADMWINVGRGLAADRRTREDTVAALRTAETLAPQRFRADPWVREVVQDLRRRARRDAVKRELKAMAWRLGLPDD